MLAQRKRVIIWSVIAALVVFAFATSFLPQPVTVKLYDVKRNPMRVELNAEGSTRVHDVFVLSAPLNGLMRRIESHVGDIVVGNETVLISIEPVDPSFLDVRSEAEASAALKAAESAKSLAQAEVERARAELDYATSDYARIRDLVTQGSASQRELDAAKRTYKTTRATLATAQSGLDVRSFDLERARARLLSPTDTPRSEGCACIDITAPVSGNILRIANTSERVVSTGEPILEIGDPHDLEIVADYLSVDAVKIERGADVRIDRWGGAVDLVGRVRYVEPTGFTKVSALGIEEQRVNVIIDITSPPEQWQRLGHGYQVDTNIVVWESSDAITIPLTAVFRDGERWATYVARDGIANQQIIELGHRNSRIAEVKNGLDPGDQVILHPSNQISEGIRINSQTQ